MKVVDLANEIYVDELGEPSDTTIAAISEWIRGKVGALNIKIHTSYAVNESTLEIVDTNSNELSVEAGDIIKKMYLVGYYARKHTSSLTTMEADVLQAFSTEDGGSFRKLNRNEIAKGIMEAKKLASEELDIAVANYQSHTSTPRQVTGDDNIRNNTVYTVPN